jgi:membrane-associated phospholipid phosphatase
MPRWFRFRFLVLALAVAAFTGCSDDDEVTPRFSDPEAVEPTAGSWRSWIISDGAAHRPDAPPSATSNATETDLDELHERAADRSASDLENIAHWNGGTVRRWNELQRSLIASNSQNPPRASRGLALVSVAMYDAMVAAWDAKYTYLRPRPSAIDATLDVEGAEPKSPSYVSERAAISAAAADVLKSIFPGAAAQIDEKLASAIEADLDAGIHFRGDVEAGLEIGHAVAAEVLAWAANDNSSNTTPPVARLEGDPYWVPTAPGFVQNPLEPGCGNWRTWILPNGAAVNPPAPPAYGSDEFNSQVAEVWAVNQDLPNNPGRLAIAQFWADGAGTVTPPGHWNQIAVDLAVEKGLNEPRMARMLALLGAAQADAFIACWYTKFTYWCLRPITEIRRDYDANWLPPIGTPPFPSYPSGHSTTSGAASSVLAFIFPDEAVSLSQMGLEAMNSRLYGGIHFSFDNLTGFSMGTSIGSRAIDIALHDGCPTP